MIDVVPLRYGAAFKKAFGNQEVFCQFVHDIFGINVTVDRVHEEFAYPEQIGLVAIKYDLFADIPQKRLIVEIQHAKHMDFLDRFMHYHLCGIVEQAKDHKHYVVEKAVYTVVVLTSVPRDDQRLQCSEIVTEFHSLNEFGKRGELYAHKLIFLNPNLVNDQTAPATRTWLELIKDSLDGKVDETRFPSSCMQKVIAEIKATSVSPELLAKIKDEAAWEQTRQYAKEEGVEEGVAKRNLEIAQNMVREGIDAAMIMKVTGLTAQQIQELKAQL